MEEFKEWLRKAEEDFDTAKYNLEGNKLAAGVFFLQQSVEKSLKALIIKKKGEIVRTHDLIILGKRINAPKKIMEYCKELTPAYQYTRYPDVPREEKLGERADVLVSYAEEVLEWVKKNI